MHLVLRKHWRSIALKGLAALVFAVLALTQPSVTLTTLVLVIGAYAMFDGALTIRIGVRARHHPGGFGFLMQGVLRVLLGVAAMLLTQLTMAVLVYALAIWGIVTGFLELWLAYRMRRFAFAAPYWALAGAASLALGLVLFIKPEPLLTLFVIGLGLYALVYGVAMLLLAYKLRRIEVGLPSTSNHHEPLAH